MREKRNRFIVFYSLRMYYTLTQKRNMCIFFKSINEFTIHSSIFIVLLISSVFERYCLVGAAKPPHIHWPFLLETRNGWFIQKRVSLWFYVCMVVWLNAIQWSFLSIFKGFTIQSTILFCIVLYFWSILRETLWSGAAKPPHIYWPAFLKLKIESWERS